MLSNHINQLTTVQKVNLLDVNCEPTDAELAALMSDMMVNVRAENSRLMASLYQNMALDFERLKSQYA